MQARMIRCLNSNMNLSIKILLTNGNQKQYIPYAEND